MPIGSGTPEGKQPGEKEDIGQAELGVGENVMGPSETQVKQPSPEKTSKEPLTFVEPPKEVSTETPTEIAQSKINPVQAQETVEKVYRAPAPGSVAEANELTKEVGEAQGT